MSDKKEFNEMNEQELEQVSGGENRDCLFYCPRCECHSLVYSNLAIGQSGPSCPLCKYREGIDVIMTRVS